MKYDKQAFRKRLKRWEITINHCFVTHGNAETEPSTTKVNHAKETLWLDAITLAQVLGLTYEGRAELYPHVKANWWAGHQVCSPRNMP